MSPEEFVDEVARLIADGKDEQALELGSLLREEMLPKLSREQFWRVCSLMEGAQLVVDLAEAERAQRQPVETPFQLSATRPNDGPAVRTRLLRYDPGRS